MLKIRGLGMKYTGTAGILYDRLKSEILVADGAFGTYYAKKYDTGSLPELANLQASDRVLAIHKEYIEAGAKIIRTNTFASNTVCLGAGFDEVRNNIKNAVDIAREAVKGTDVLVAADIGPIPGENMIEKEHIEKEYVDIVNVFKECGVDIFVFETFPELGFIDKAIENAGENGFVITQFAINQFGYSSAGFSARKLIEEAEKNSYIDACGFNCGVGPGHMKKLVQSLINRNDKYFAVLPNAGYPQVVSGRMVFDDNNAAYFSQIMHDLAEDGADIIGGCCGTTPEYIAKLENAVKNMHPVKHFNEEHEKKIMFKPIDKSFYKDKSGKKLIAVELAPPVDSDDEKLMDAAHILQKSGVDVLTFPDSPSGRTRADSILMAEKVHKETGMTVMPHICCRDKNAIAMRSQLLGAHLNDINNFLVITGDPIPSMVRQSVKAVFNFDSVGLMNIIKDMNESQFENSPIVYGGAINQTRRNLDVEISRVRKKMDAGATFFLTQPVFDDKGIARLRQIKQETGARILCGIMPFVSLRNATFMKNEMTGINVTDEILSRYRADMSKEEGEETGIQIAREIIAKTTDFVDGYYFSFPFNRVHMLKKIIGKNNQ